MPLLSPDVLAEAQPRQLSPLLPLLGLALGLVLWLYGARGHRFWLSLGLTVAAGSFGLMYGPAYGLQPLVAGLLLAVSVGALALSLVRLLLFGAGGLAALGLIRALAPNWDEPLACFLAGGLLGVLLYRFWITALTSLAGTVLMGYAVLCLLERFARVDAVGLARKNGPLLNWGCASVAVLGVLVQLLLERRRARGGEDRKASPAPPPPAKPAPPPPPPPSPPPEPWWKWPGKFLPGRAA